MLVDSLPTRVSAAKECHAFLQLLVKAAALLVFFLAAVSAS
jgi:hypothetical protein